MTDWFAKVPPLMPSSIAPVPQDRPPILFVLVAFALLGVLPFVGFILWAGM